MSASERFFQPASLIARRLIDFRAPIALTRTKHFRLEIADTSFAFARKQAQIAAEAALDGIYVLRTSVAAKTRGRPPGPTRSPKRAAPRRPSRGTQQAHHHRRSLPLAPHAARRARHPHLQHDPPARRHHFDQLTQPTRPRLARSN